MRLFYNDEGPIDTLLQIAEKPTRDMGAMGGLGDSNVNQCAFQEQVGESR